MSVVQDKARSIGRRLAELIARVPARRVDMGIALLVTALGLLVYAYVVTGWNQSAGASFIQNVELRSLDARFKARGQRSVDPRIVIVGIDEKTLQKVGSFPIARNYYAQLLEILAADGVKAVGFDIDFPTPEKNSALEALKELESEIGSSASADILEKIRRIERTSDNDAVFADAIKRANSVVLGHIFLDERRAKAIDPQAVIDYHYILSDHPFPKMQTVHGDSAQGQDPRIAWNNDWEPERERRGGLRLGDAGYAIEPNIRILAEAARSHGFFNDIPDSDGTYRRSLTLTLYRGPTREELKGEACRDAAGNAHNCGTEFFPSLDLELVRQYENIKLQSVVGYITGEGLERIEFGPHTLKTASDGTLLVNYAGPYLSYPHYSLADVLDRKIPREKFEDKIVLVGGTALGIGDLRPTPFQSSDFMGTEIHANVVDNILNNETPGRGFLSRGSREEMVDLVFIVVFGVGMGLLFGRIKPLYSTFSVVLGLMVFAAIVYYAFAHFGMWLFFVIPAGTLVLNYASITSFRMIFEEREKRKVRRTFERYVSPGVIKLIEGDPKKYFKTGGELKELTIMFADIRSFTTIAEGLTPNELVGLLNEYLGEMTDIIFKQWGTLDKYIGDAIMAFWGSPYPQPDHALRACSAALEMSARLEELNLKWEVEGRKQLSIGVGVNTGPVNVGNMGSDRRFSWTVMGDDVNLASRLEGTNKEYRTTRIISEFTYNQVRENFVCRYLDKIRVKGKTKPVGIYELLAFSRNAGSYADLLKQFADAQASYWRQDWDDAIARFEALLTRYPDDGPGHEFLRRCHDYRKAAPAKDWDGVYEMKTK